jgi:phosphate:Na+ symporter
MLATIFGGIGLFLLGMVMMTEGLKAIAGSSLNRILARFTSQPLMGIFSGALVTALVQSSSATTLMTIGFVSAGLLTFKQTLGLILGINLGTTSTGWIVSQFGFNVSFTSIALPLVAIGTLGKLFGEGKFSHYASSLAGFGLIFLGISTIQSGMSDVAARYDPASFPSGGIAYGLLLVLIGFGMTVVMQSSSAALATTLTALYASAITIDQAAALVIGQNVGTTVKAAIAAVGSTNAAKQTAMAHITFNLLTALIAFISLPWLIGSLSNMAVRFDWRPTTTLAAFHTSFNVMGVLIFFPFMNSVASIFNKISPDRLPQLTRSLNPKTLRVYSAAVEAARQATLDVALGMAELAYEALTGQVKQKPANERVMAAHLALSETRHFLSEVRPEGGEKLDQQRHVSVLHAIDHLRQLEETLKEIYYAGYASQAETCQDALQLLCDTLSEVLELVKSGDLQPAAEQMGQKSQHIADLRRQQRRDVLDKTALYQIEPKRAMHELESMRWLDRVAYHIWRSIYHLQMDGHPEDSEPVEETRD